MTVFQFVGLCPSCTSQQLITQTDAHTRTDRPSPGPSLRGRGVVTFSHLCGQELPNVPNSHFTLLGIARTVSQEQAVELQLVEVVVPRHTNHLKPTTYQATDDVGLHAAIYQHHSLPCTYIISNDLLAAHLLHPVHASVFLLSRMLRQRRSPINNYPPHHHAMLAEHLREPPRIDTRDGRNLLTLQP